MKKPITYDLTAGKEDSDQFYSQLEVFSDQVQQEILNRFGWLFELYRSALA